MTQRIMEICAEVQDYLNKSYNYFGKKFCNVDKHVFDIKQRLTNRFVHYKEKIWIRNYQ